MNFCCYIDKKKNNVYDIFQGLKKLTWKIFLLGVSRSRKPQRELRFGTGVERDGDTALRLRTALTALPQDWGSVPGTHAADYNQP